MFKPTSSWYFCYGLPSKLTELALLSFTFPGHTLSSKGLECSEIVKLRSKLEQELITEVIEYNSCFTTRKSKSRKSESLAHVFTVAEP